MAAALEISRLGIEVNLPQGASYDLLVVSTPEGYPKGQVDFVFEETPRKITGIQKVAQTFMRLLFTQKGTCVLRPSMGTIFPELVIGANRTSTDSQFRSQVYSAIKDAESQTKYVLNTQSSSLADQLNSATIKGYFSNKESLSLYVQLSTKAGELASVAVPFPELDLKLSN